MSRPSILAIPSVVELATFLEPDTLIAFDFDGVLAPIVTVRTRAHIHKRTHALLRTVVSRYPCIVVSGRPLADLVSRLDGIPFRMAFGNFGHEPADPGTAPPRVVAEWVTELSRTLSSMAGIFIEDKRYSVAVHYRHAANPSRARVLIERAVSDFRGVRVLEGTKAVTLLPRTGPDKGTTLQRARRLLRCSRAIYIGDDGTDEDAFGSDVASRLLSIRVGRAVQTSARFRLPRQADVDHLLEAMLVKSTRGSAPRVPRAAHRS